MEAASYSFVFSAYVGTPAQMAETLRAEAREQVKAWPQYTAYFGPEWRLARLARIVRTKMGLQGSAGDLVLFRPHRDGDGMENSVEFWSRRSAIGVVVPRSAIVEVG